MHVLRRDEKEGRKKQARSINNNKAMQHNTPKAVTFPKKSELSRVELEPTTLSTPEMYVHNIVQIPYISYYNKYMCLLKCVLYMYIG